MAGACTPAPVIEVEVDSKPLVFLGTSDLVWGTRPRPTAMQPYDIARRPRVTALAQRGRRDGTHRHRRTLPAGNRRRKRSHEPAHAHFAARRRRSGIRPGRWFGPGGPAAIL